MSMATSFFYIYVLATSFFYIYIDIYIDNYIDGASSRSIERNFSSSSVEPRPPAKNLVEKSVPVATCRLPIKWIFHDAIKNKYIWQDLKI